LQSESKKITHTIVDNPVHISMLHEIKATLKAAPP
jgi:hypothetical protein